MTSPPRVLELLNRAARAFEMSHTPNWHQGVIMELRLGRTRVQDDDRYTYFSPHDGLWVVWDRDLKAQVRSYSEPWRALRHWQELMGITGCSGGGN